MKKRKAALLMIGFSILLFGCQKQPVTAVPEVVTTAETSQPDSSQTASEESTAVTETTQTADLTTVAEEEPEPTAGSSREPETAADRQITKLTGYAVPYPAVNPTYTYENGIQAEYNSVETGFDNQWITYIQIDGLANRQIQEQINNKLKDTVVNLYHAELPPYRGIKVFMPEREFDKEKSLIGVTSSVRFNASNIFSVLITKGIEINRIDDNGAEYSSWIHQSEALNFDLNTGNEIEFGELFADGYDHQQEVADYVRRCMMEKLIPNLHYKEQLDLISEEINDFEMIRPYTYRKDQKFILGSPNQILMIFDYDTPEFDVGYSPKSIPLQPELFADKGAGFALLTRYETFDDRLYTGEYQRDKLLMAVHYDDSQVNEAVNFALGTTSTGKWPNLEVEIMDGIENDQIREKVRLKSETLEQRLLASMLEQNLKIEDYESIYARYSLDRYGDYLMERDNFDFYGEAMTFNSLNQTVTDLKTGKEVTLSECFQDGTDINTLVLQAFAALPEHLRKNNHLTEQQIIEKLPTCSFALYSNMITITLDHENFMALYYADLGYDNLTIFK